MFSTYIPIDIPEFSYDQVTFFTYKSFSISHY